MHLHYFNTQERFEAWQRRWSIHMGNCKRCQGSDPCWVGLALSGQEPLLDSIYREDPDGEPTAAGRSGKTS